ncbi:MAG: hypothetical protein HOG71_03570 [Bacteroidetes bacterium]|jgi:hypothetical protein|nr:hypothetical protein [Bacteroidota bacterium]
MKKTIIFLISISCIVWCKSPKFDVTLNDGGKISSVKFVKVQNDSIYCTKWRKQEFVFFYGDIDEIKQNQYSLAAYGVLIGIGVSILSQDINLNTKNLDFPNFAGQ